MNGKTVLNTSKVNKSSKDDNKRKKNKKGVENFYMEHTLNPNKKVFFQKVDCGNIDSVNDYNDNSSVGTAKNVMIKSLIHLQLKIPTPKLLY